MSKKTANRAQWTCFPYTIPNVFSLIRLVAAPFIVAAAFLGAHNAFLVIFAVGMFTDFADGMAARLLHQRSDLGVKLDAFGDIAVYTASAMGGWILWPEKLLGESFLIMTVIAALIASGGISLVMHRQLPLYHTWLTKCASAALGISTFLLFIGLYEITFKIALCMMIASSLEEICVTLIIPASIQDIRSIPDALRKRKEVLG